MPGFRPTSRHTTRFTSRAVIGSGRVILLALRVLVVLIAFALLAHPALAQSDETAIPDGAVYIVPITGTIDLGLAPYLSRVLAEAEEAGAAAVILDIDTPGG